MNEDLIGAHDAKPAADPSPLPVLWRPVPVCRYCKKPDPSWTEKDLERGRRSAGDGIHYHCYEGYCLD